MLTIPWFECVLHCAVHADLKFLASKMLPLMRIGVEERAPIGLIECERQLST